MSVTAYPDEVSGMIRARCFAGGPAAVQLGQRISEFTETAVTATMVA